METFYKYEPIKHKRLNAHQKMIVLSTALSGNSGEWDPKPYDHYTVGNTDLELYQVLEVTEKAVVTRKCSNGSYGAVSFVPKEEFFDNSNPATKKLYVPMAILDGVRV